MNVYLIENEVPASLSREKLLDLTLYIHKLNSESLMCLVPLSLSLKHTHLSEDHFLCLSRNSVYRWGWIGAMMCIFPVQFYFV